MLRPRFSANTRCECAVKITNGHSKGQYSPIQDSRLGYIRLSTSSNLGSWLNDQNDREEGGSCCWNSLRLPMLPLAHRAKRTRILPYLEVRRFCICPRLTGMSLPPSWPTSLWDLTPIHVAAIAAPLLTYSLWQPFPNPKKLVIHPSVSDRSFEDTPLLKRFKEVYPEDFYEGGGYAALPHGKTHYYLLGPEDAPKACPTTLTLG